MKRVVCVRKIHLGEKEVYEGKTERRHEDEEDVDLPACICDCAGEHFDDDLCGVGCISIDILVRVRWGRRTTYEGP